MTFLLITRPLDEAQELEKSLHLPVLKAPLLEIELIPQENIPKASDFTGLIVTSARSLRIFSNISAFLKKPIWCVGARTALKAKNLGFETIYTADNSAKELCQLILSKTSSKEEKFLHICGEDLHFDVVKKLQEEGYQADKVILYKAVPLKHFSEAVIKEFIDQRIHMIPIYSRRTAEALQEVLGNDKLEPYLKKIILVSCSTHIIEPLQKYKWYQIIITDDLSATTLANVYHKTVGAREIKMLLKKSWPLLVGTAVISTLFSIGGILFLAPRLLPIHPPIDMQKIQQEVGQPLKAEIQSDLAPIHTQITDLAAKSLSLEQEINVLKQQPTPLASPLPITATDRYLKAYIFVGQLEEQIKNSKADPILWQQIEKLLLEMNVVLPENLEGLKIIPLAKQDLIQQLKSLQVSPVSEATVNVPAEKVGHHWFQKVEKYIGQIVITKAGNSPPQPIALSEQALQAISNENLDQIKILKEDPNITESIKNILVNAEKRLQILEGLRTLKSLLLQLSHPGKE